MSLLNFSIAILIFLFFLNNNLFLGAFRNLKFQYIHIDLKQKFYMIQAQKHQNFSKLYLKLQKKPNFFTILKILKMDSDHRITIKISTILSNFLITIYERS
jgi:hypothetical protein